MTVPVIDVGTTYRGRVFRDFERSEAIRNAVFIDCVFDGMRWRQIRLDSCRFVACNFTDCDLSLADIEGSIFRDVSFDACSLTGIAWDRAADTLHDPFGVDFRGCVVSFGQFRGVRLEDRRIDQCVAHECDFRDAKLAGATCRGTDFRASDFSGADLRGVDFRYARNYSIDVRETTIAGARFSMPDAAALLDGLDIVVDAPSPQD